MNIFSLCKHIDETKEYEDPIHSNTIRQQLKGTDTHTHTEVCVCVHTEVCVCDSIQRRDYGEEGEQRKAQVDMRARKKRRGRKSWQDEREGSEGPADV